jgi:hypothetical protein
LCLFRGLLWSADRILFFPIRVRVRKGGTISAIRLEQRRKFSVPCGTTAEGRPSPTPEISQRWDGQISDLRSLHDLLRQRGRPHKIAAWTPPSNISPRTPGGHCSRGHSSGFFRSNCSLRSNQQAAPEPQHREKVSQKSLSSRCAGAELCDQMEWMLRLPRWRTVDLRKTLQWRSRGRTSCTDLGTKS